MDDQQPHEIDEAIVHSKEHVMNDYERSSRDRRWNRHRESVLYAIAFVGLVLFGLLWHGALSLILSPLWMLIVVWIVPSSVARLVEYRR